MKEGKDIDRVEEALLEMGRYDAAEAAIERAEAAGEVVEVPRLSSRTMDAIVAASLRAAAGPPAEPSRPAPASRRWIPWGVSVAGALAAALVLWLGFATADRPVPEVGPLPAAQLRIGGTARALGDAPPIRAYGPGDSFFAELAFEAPASAPIVAGLFARNSAGAVVQVDLAHSAGPEVVRFEGELAQVLSPGVWSLEVRYGWSTSCAVSSAEGCETREKRVEVVGP